jgi:hypothetical protein
MATAGSALAVVGTVVVAKVCELVNRARTRARTTSTKARSLTVLMLS